MQGVTDSPLIWVGLLVFGVAMWLVFGPSRHSRRDYDRGPASAGDTDRTGFSLGDGDDT